MKDSELMLTAMTCPAVIKHLDPKLNVLHPNGNLAMGPSHIPGIGPVIHIAVHAPDGTVLLVTMGATGAAEFASTFNHAMRAIMAGQFDHPAGTIQ